MLIEDHYFADPREIIVDDVQVFNRSSKSGKLVEEPIITLRYRRDLLTLKGKSLMWDLLDALHSNPLPRNPINIDLFRPTLDTDPAHTDVRQAESLLPSYRLNNVNASPAGTLSMSATYRCNSSIAVNS